MKGLEGLKVVELTSYVAGPVCPRILAEMVRRFTRLSLLKVMTTATMPVASGCRED